MATEKTVEVKPPSGGWVGDRVAMLSIRKDGTADQHNPEFLDEEFALEASKVQFRENAVSAVDDQKRTEANAAQTGDAEGATQDPFIKELKDAHDKAAESAEKQAESVVKALAPSDKK